MLCLLLALPLQAAEWSGAHDHGRLQPLPQTQVSDYRESADLERRYPLQALQRISGQLRYDGVQAQGRHLAVTYALAAGHGHREALQQAREQLQGQGAHLLFWCEGRECGSAALWANAIFQQPRLSAADEQQAFSLLRQDDSLLALYAVTRGNRRAYLHAEQLDAAAPLGEILPVAATLLRQLRSGQALNLPAEPEASRVRLLARALNQDITLRVLLAGTSATAWRDALVAAGVRGTRLEIDAGSAEAVSLRSLR